MTGAHQILIGLFGIILYLLKALDAGKLPDCYEAYKQCRQVGKDKWGGYLYDNKCYYQTVVAGSHDWSNAMLACRRQHRQGRLAAISSIEVAGIILKRFKENHDPYASKTCMDARDNQCSWWWINGFISDVQNKINGSNLTLADFKIMDSLSDADKNGLTVANTYLNSTTDYFVPSKLLEDNPGLEFMCMYLNITKNDVRGFPTECSMTNNAWGICEIPMKCEIPEDIYDWSIVCPDGYDPIADHCYKFAPIPHNYSYILTNPCNGAELATFNNSTRRQKFLAYWKQKYAFARYIWMGPLESVPDQIGAVMGWGFGVDRLNATGGMDILESLCAIADWTTDSIKRHPCSAQVDVPRGSGNVPHYAFCREYKLRDMTRTDYQERVKKLVEDHVIKYYGPFQTLPVLKTGQPIVVDVGWEFLNILMVEVHQTAWINCRVSMKWQDGYIRWNASSPKYGGVKSIRRHMWGIWRPLLRIQDFIHGAYHGYFYDERSPWVIYSNGTIFGLEDVNAPVSAPVLGTFDRLKAFPHDYHTAVLTLADFRYYGNQLKLKLNIAKLSWYPMSTCGYANASKFRISTGFKVTNILMCYGNYGYSLLGRRAYLDIGETGRPAIRAVIVFDRVFPLFDYQYWPMCIILTLITLSSLLAPSGGTSIILTTACVLLWLIMYYTIQPMLPIHGAPSLLIFYAIGLILTAVCFVINIIVSPEISDYLTAVPGVKRPKSNGAAAGSGGTKFNILCRAIGWGTTEVIRRISLLLLVVLYAILSVLRLRGVI